MENSINNYSYFFSSEDDNDEECVMHSKSDNIRIMMSVKWKKKFTKLFDLLKNRYQNNLESMRDSAFIFEYV